MEDKMWFLISILFAAHSVIHPVALWWLDTIMESILDYRDDIV